MKSLFQMCMSESTQMVTFSTASGDSQSPTISPTNIQLHFQNIADSGVSYGSAALSSR